MSKPTPEKVVLKSQIFKNKNGTPSHLRSVSRSPINTSLKSNSDLNDPNDIFQKVCCPNCRYLFKTIKGYEINEKKKNETKTIQVQVEEKYLTSVKKQLENYAQTEQKISIHISQLSPPLDVLSKKDSIKNNSSKNDSQLRPDDHLNQSTYKFESLNNKSQLKQVPQEIKIHSISINEASKSQTSDMSKNKKGKKPDQKSMLSKNSSLSKLDPSFVKQMAYLYENNLERTHIYDFCRFLPSKMEIPAYLKILVKSDIEQACKKDKIVYYSQNQLNSN